MLPVLIRGGCVANGRCDKFCTSFQKVDKSEDNCGWCNHHICEHSVIGVVDVNGNYTSSITAVAAKAISSIPVSSSRDRNFSFNRAGIYTPNAAGT